MTPAFLVTDEAHAAAAAALGYSGQITRLDDLLAAPANAALLAARRRQAVDVDPLYINFTSGSTGVPKGVTVSHRSVLDFIPQFAEIFGITQNDILGNQAPFDFDVSVKDLYTALYTGAKVQIIPRAYFSQPTKLMDYLADHEVTILVWAVSAMCFVSIMNGFSYRIPSHVRQVLFSGEVMPIKHLMKWKSALPHARFVNLYGPTEITCNCTYAILPDRDFAPDEALPIGRAFPNEKVFLLDENDALVTVPGQAGEICVSGTALALGYYADPVRTAQAFTQNPLNTNWYERIYRTGDLARYDESGSLYYIGRRDFQIKHMGHRVELGEIEAAAMRCDAVTRACCTFDAERQRLHLFYTGSCEKAALLAARKGKKAITEPEIEEASIKVVAGPEKKSRVVTDAEKRLTSYHEAGHAITGYFCKTHDPVHQISIIPRGSAGGFTMYLPEKDPSYVTKTAMNENIVCLLGGRVAEQLVLDDISTGASNDLQRATDTARAMVTRYGFSERMGPVVYGTDPGETFLGRDFGQGKGYSENTASEIDNEIRDIMDESYETARRILTEHMTELHRVAGVLMEREKISGEEFDALMKGENLAPFGLDTPAPAAAPASAEQPAAPEQPSEPSDEN